MKKNVKAIFDKHCKSLSFDNALVKRISDYRLAFVNKNQDHIEFFGGHLLGVHDVKFLPKDRASWFDEVLKADEQELEDDLLDLPEINADFHVSSDTMNLSIVWIVNGIYNSHKISQQNKTAGMIDALKILLYKFFTSRMKRHFVYPAKPEVAEALYAALSGKFAIKQAGSWENMFYLRALDILSDKGLHKHALRVMSDDAKVVYFLNDTQTRIRKMLKLMYDLYLRIYHSGVRVTTTSAVMEHDGEMILKDRTHGVLVYRNYIESVIGDRNSFIKTELTEVIQKAINTMPERLFIQTLEWMSDNVADNKHGGKVHDIVSGTIVHMFHYFQQNKNLLRSQNDFPAIITRLKGVYMSSKSTDPDLLDLRNWTEAIVKQATGNKNSTVQASVRTGVLLYLVLRTICKNYYTS